MVGLVQRHEALRVFGRREDRGRVLDADDPVDRRMQDEQRLAHGSDTLGEPGGAHVVDELAADPEASPAELHRGLSIALDLGKARTEILQHVARIGRSADRDDRTCFRNIPGRGQDRGTAERMADQQRGGFEIIAKEFRGGD